MAAQMAKIEGNQCENNGVRRKENIMASKRRRQAFGVGNIWNSGGAAKQMLAAQYQRSVMSKKYQKPENRRRNRRRRKSMKEMYRA